ncbi:MAG: anaerobic ribonucleoside triphosphate reductase, partial [Erysipelothrix sp.]|nr:anaerobic ribonucleoside triphosphate reductase [Erysipelothrix sp.]
MTQNTSEKLNQEQPTTPSLNENKQLQIVKRDGKLAKYQPEKIALAIKKAFDAVNNPDYQTSEIHRVYLTVTQSIEKNSRIEIEDIQDTIEKTLLDFNFKDVYDAFSSYRDHRASSREHFMSKQHKFLKSVEQLSIKDSGDVDEKRENANINGDGAMGMMLQYGSTISKQFSKSYLISKEYVDAHEEGTIHIHDMDFIPMGTTTCCQIDLEALFENGFSTGHGHLREPKDIASYSALAAIAIQSNQNDQHGGQSIPAFDYALAKGVVCTFRKQLKQLVADYYDLHDDQKDYQPIIAVINQIDSLDQDFNAFTAILNDDELSNKLVKKAFAKTDRLTYQAMEAFIHNLNTMHSRAGAQVPFSSINFGTDTSQAGRLVTKNYLLALESGLGKNETPIFPISIFKVKEGVNYFESDPNYDLFLLSCEVSAKRMFPNFSFLDAPFNKQHYKEGNYHTETTYMGCRTRVMADVTDPDNEIVTGRGNLSFTSINLPRLGIKHGLLSGNKQADWAGFYEELKALVELTKNQLLERLEIQKNKRVLNFPFLMGQGVWKNSKTLKPTDTLGDILNTGTLTIGFIGLAECLVAMIGEHHGQSDFAQKKGLEIVSFIRNMTDEYSKE